MQDKNNQTLQKNILELIKPEDVHLKIPEVVIYNSKWHEVFSASDWIKQTSWYKFMTF